jgi:2-dehydropantoate 2-reductase
VKIAIVGAGGVGGYLGALLARAGHEVALIARGEHLRAMQVHGIRVESVHGDFTARPALVTDRPAEAGVADLIVFTVKTYDTDEAASAARMLAGPGALILPLQNGVESAARLAPVFGAEHVLGGATWVVVSVASPGLIRQESQVRRIVFGAIDGRPNPRLEPVRETLASTGFAVERTDAITHVLWTKFLFIASVAGLTSVMRAPLGPILARAEGKDLLRRAMEEVEAVARARGVTLDPDVVEKTMLFAEGLEPTTTSSMARDVAAGKRTEHDALSGAVVRAGRERGVPTPVHELCWACLRVLDARSR